MTAPFDMRSTIAAEWDWLRACARKVSCSGIVPEDLLQSAIVQMLEHADDYRDRGNWRAWAATLIYNQMCSNHRRERVRATDPITLAIEETIGHPSSQEEQMDAEMFLGRFVRLPHHRFLPLAELVFEGLSHEQIAARHGVALGTAKSATFRARQLMIDGTYGERKKKNTPVLADAHMAPNLAALTAMVARREGARA